MSGWGWQPYVSVAQRRAKARQMMEQLRKRGVQIQPVEIEGRKIVRTFWGAAWCDHLEAFSTFQNRLPRGRTYVRNGSVCHLEIANGSIKAKVSGSDMYDVEVKIEKLPETKWQTVKQKCSGQIGSLLELLQGQLSKSVMSIVTHRTDGIFPQPREIKFSCSCPDWATMCKHVAAVLYGVGARLDQQPELLFLLRGVEHIELIETNVAAATTSDERSGRRRIADSDLEDVFGISMFEDGIESAAADEHNSLENSRTDNIDNAGSGANSGQVLDFAPSTSNKRSLRAITKSASDSRADRKNTTFPQPRTTDHTTGEGVREMRARLDLTKSQFASLVCVSPNTITRWEMTEGPLTLKPRTRAEILKAAKLSPKTARKRLGLT